MPIDYERDTTTTTAPADTPTPRTAQRGSRTPDQERHSDLPPVMPAGLAVQGLAEVAESALDGLTESTIVDERMQRFPELRGVEVAVGAAARFPELADLTRPMAEQAEAEDEQEVAR